MLVLQRAALLIIRTAAGAEDKDIEKMIARAAPGTATVVSEDELVAAASARLAEIEAEARAVHDRRDQRCKRQAQGLLPRLWSAEPYGSGTKHYYNCPNDKNL